MNGMNFPRLTTVERDAIPAPSDDLVIFNTDSTTHERYNGTSWVVFAGGGGGAAAQITRVRIISTFDPVPLDAWEPVPWTVEDRDDLGVWNIGNPTQFVIQDTGDYLVGASLRWGGSATNFDFVATVNSLVPTFDASDIFIGRGYSAVEDTERDTYYSVFKELTAGDVVRLSMFDPAAQGGAVTLLADSSFWLINL